MSSGLFRIVIDYLSKRTYPHYEKEFIKAAETWMRIVRNPYITLIITVRVIKVGDGQILGHKAGPTKGVKIGKKVFPISGVMEFDVWDVEQMIKEKTLHEAILHDMGHVLGIGCLWDDYLSDPVYSGNNNSLRVSAGRSLSSLRGGGLRESTGNLRGGLRGSSGAGSLKGSGEGNLLESGGGLRASGGCEDHWRETVFRTDIMSGRYPEKGDVTVPLRQNIIGSLLDIGYGVDNSQAELYPVASKSQSFINLGTRPTFKVLTSIGKSKL
jgi:hypothetical protein